jgi:lysozyme
MAVVRRRWLVALVVAVAAGVVSMSMAWRLLLPDYRPPLHDGEAYGIDVSEHQGRIDWNAVSRDHVAFAYLKATEGEDHVDRWFPRNWSGAARAGITRGAYHFFTLCARGEEQARNFLHAVPSDLASLPPALDLELAGNCHARPSRAAVELELRTYLQQVEAATGRRVVLYVAGDFEQRYAVRESFDRPAWSRRLLRRPSEDGWVVWQVDGVAHVNGVQGDVDLDVFRERITQG